MTSPLHGRRILVTGGTAGIGAAAVHVLSEARGRRCRDISPDAASLPRRALSWMQCDLRGSSAVDDMVSGAAEHSVDSMSCCTRRGCGSQGFPRQITGEDIDFLVDTNLKATIFTNQAAYSIMRKDGGGRNEAVRFGEAVMGSPIAAVYASTKGAVSAWTRSVARAWAAEKVSAAIAAWRPRCRRRARTVSASSSAQRGRTSSTNRSSRRFLSAAHWAIRSSDLGPVLVFLCSEGSRFITGQLIAVDGGLVMLGAWRRACAPSSLRWQGISPA